VSALFEVAFTEAIVPPSEMTTTRDRAFALFTISPHRLHVQRIR
jgi:hypothetical protein